VHLVGCIIGIYYDARTYKYKITYGTVVFYGRPIVGFYVFFYNFVTQRQISQLT